MVMRCQFSRCNIRIPFFNSYHRLQPSRKIAWNCILFLKTHVIHLLTSLKRCLDSCGQSSRWLSIDKRVARMNGSRWSWWGALRSNQCWHYPVCTIEKRMNINVSVTKEDILIIAAVAAAAVTVVKVVIVVVFWKHSLDDLVVLIGHVPSRSEWQLPSRRSDNRKIAWPLNDDQLSACSWRASPPTATAWSLFPFLNPAMNGTSSKLSSSRIPRPPAIYSWQMAAWTWLCTYERSMYVRT